MVNVVLDHGFILEIVYLRWVTLDFSVNLNQQISFALMFTVALGIKVPVFPFHLWLPEVHSETDTCGSVLLAGVLLKVGSYGLMRFTLTLFPVGYSY